ncbi:GNAT family N-acetyltransferase [Nocardioides sp.]|uniref:GNAT family N-acetyltransferase n=1 Tax=Nocardioides sp. TaxID=35761 RepID=UPI0039C9E45D
MPTQSRTTESRPQIRRLDPADLDAVVDLSLLAWEPVFTSFEQILGATIFDKVYRPHWRTAQAESVRTNCLATGAETFVMATTSGDVVGFLVLMQDQEESLGVIEMIAVHPRHQRRGHGRGLMEFAIQRLRDQGLTLINVGTGGDPGHAPARALYEAVGFTGVPLVSYYLATDEDSAAPRRPTGTGWTDNSSHGHDRRTQAGPSGGQLNRDRPTGHGPGGVVPGVVPLRS